MLHGQKTQLRFDDYTSNWFEIRNSIGQGDPLSMLLYIIYDSDLVDTPKSKKELTLAFVDVTVFITIGNSFQETHDILLDMLARPGGGFDWSKDHNSKFKASKFALINFTMSKTTKPPNDDSWDYNQTSPLPQVPWSYHRPRTTLERAHSIHYRKRH